MRSSADFLMKVFEAAHEKRNRIIAGLLVLSLLVFAGVFWQLRYTGITMTSAPICGVEEHYHTEACGEYVLIDSAVTLEEASAQSEIYVVTDTGYTALTDVAAEILEPQYDAYYQLSAESCSIEEHTHSTRCYCDTTADVEDAAMWESTLPQGLGNDWSDNLVAIAVSQLGYAESELNFQLSDTGERMGYTRYGQWYNNLYGDWDTMFTSFCVYYAGYHAGEAYDEVPYASGADSWMVRLDELGLYRAANGETPAVGDIVFFDTDGDGDLDRTGIIEQVSEDALTVIEGNCYLGTEAADKVCRINYDLSDAAIAGYYSLPEIAHQLTTSGGVMLMVEDYSTDSVSTENAGIMLTADDGVTVYDFSSYVSGLTYVQATDQNGNLIDVTYDTNTNKYTVRDLVLSFDLNVAQAKLAVDWNTAYYEYKLPSAIGIPSDLIGKTWTGTDAQNIDAFEYQFVANSDESYSVRVVFLSSYLNGKSDSTVLQNGKISFGGTLSGDSQQLEGENAGDLVVTVPGMNSVVVGKENIVYDTNTDDSSSSTKNYDVSVTKEGIYDPGTGTINYKITVTSNKGTPENSVITLSDTFTANGVVLSGEVKKEDISVVKRYYNTWIAGDKENASLSNVDFTFVESTNGELFTITLPKIESDAATDTNNSCFTDYIITYSVAVDKDSVTEEGVEPLNSVSVKATDSNLNETIDATTQQNKVTVNNNTVEKEVTMESDGRLKWVITVNSSLSDIAGSQLMDEMFEMVVDKDTLTPGSDITIAPADGWEWVTDENGKPAVNFVAVSEGANKQKYTITYYTDYVMSWDGKMTNTATFDFNIANGNPEDRTSDSASYANTSLLNFLEKDMTGSTEINEDKDPVTLSWKSVVTVPSDANGIPVNSVIYDDITGGEGGAYNSEAKFHYMSYAQAVDFINKYSTLTLSNGQTFSDIDLIFGGYSPDENYGTYRTYYYNAAESSWYESTNYVNTNSPAGFDLSAMTKMSGNPENIHFVQFFIRFNSSVNGSNYAGQTFTLEYNTTANVKDVESSYYYSNKITNTNEIDYADSYSVIHTVTKMNGAGNAANTSDTIEEDGYVTWQVKVVLLDGQYTAGTPVFIKDILPTGVELSKIKFSYYDEKEFSGSGTQTIADGITAVYNADTNVVEFTIASTESSNNAHILYVGNTIWVTYTCKIKANEDGSYNETPYELPNEVKVTLNGISYTDTNTQTITVTEKTPEETPELVVTPKRGTWNGANKIQYVVDINAGAEDLDPSSDTLAMTDVFSYDYHPNNTTDITQSASLLGATVKLYHAKRDANGGLIYTDDKGNVLYTTKLENGVLTYYDTDGNAVSELNGYLVADENNEVNSLVWTYTVDYRTNSYNGSIIGENCTIHLTVPDSTAMVLKYEYNIDVTYPSSWGSADMSFSNTFNVSGEDQYTDDVEEDYKYSGTAGTIASYFYSFTKVVEGNYNERIPGVVFEVWKYENGQWVNDGTKTTDSNGQFSIVLKDGDILLYDYNTAYYIVEKSTVEGYEMPTDPEKYYFYFSNSDTATYPVSMPDEEFPNYANDIATNFYTEFVENRPVTEEVKTSLVINKVWLATDGVTDMSASKQGSIDITLYRLASTTPVGSNTGSGGETEGGTTTTPDTGKVTFDFDLTNTSNYGALQILDYTAPDDGFAEGTTVDMTMYMARTNQYWGLWSGGDGSGTNSLTVTVDGAETDSWSATETKTTVTVDSTDYAIYEGKFGSITLNGNTAVSGALGNDGITSDAIIVTGDTPPTTAELIQNLDKCVIYLKITEPTTETSTAETSATSESTEPETSTVTIGNLNESDIVEVQEFKYTITAENGWKLTLDDDDLPQTGTYNGQTVYYSYYVREDVPINYEVSYDNIAVDAETQNETITVLTNGTITISNVSTGQFELPETGSIGTVLLTVNALLFMIVPVMMLFRRRENVGGEE